MENAEQCKTEETGTESQLVSGRALVDIPALGLKSGDYATISEANRIEFHGRHAFDTAATDPVRVVTASRTDQPKHDEHQFPRSARFADQSCNFRHAGAGRSCRAACQSTNDAIEALGSRRHDSCPRPGQAGWRRRQPNAQWRYGRERDANAAQHGPRHQGQNPFGTSAYDEAANDLGLGTTDP